MKTEIKDGKIYEIGKLYFFYSEIKKEGEVKILCGVSTANHPYPFITSFDERWVNCEEVKQPELGAITDAPIELVDGHAYMFEFEDNDMAGLYDEDENTIYVRGLELQIELCTNIREMVVKEND